MGFKLAELKRVPETLKQSSKIAIAALCVAIAALIFSLGAIRNGS